MEKKQWVKPVLTVIPHDDAKAEWFRTVCNLVEEYEGLKHNAPEMARAE